jgi:hypothetical protein
MSAEMKEPAHRAKTKEFRANYDRIFAEPKISMHMNDELVMKNGVRKWVALEDVRGCLDKGWRRVE